MQLVGRKCCCKGCDLLLQKKKAYGAFYSIVVGPSWRDKTCCNGSFDLLLKSLVKQYINIKSWLFWKLWTMNTFWLVCGHVSNVGIWSSQIFLPSGLLSIWWDSSWPSSLVQCRKKIFLPLKPRQGDKYGFLAETEKIRSDSGIYCHCAEHLYLSVVVQNIDESSNNRIKIKWLPKNEIDTSRWNSHSELIAAAFLCAPILARSV